MFLLQHADVSFLWHHYGILGGSNILKSVLYSSLDAIAYAIYLILFLGILFFQGQRLPWTQTVKVKVMSTKV